MKIYCKVPFYVVIGLVAIFGLYMYYSGLSLKDIFDYFMTWLFS